MRQHLGVDQRIGVGRLGDRHPLQNLAHGRLQLLTGKRARYAGNLVNIVRHVPRRQLGAQLAAESAGQVAGQFLALGQGDVEHEPPVLAELPGVDHQAVRHFGERLDDAVEIAGPHTHSVAVQRGVRAAVDDAPAVGQDRDPVAVPPHAGEVVDSSWRRSGYRVRVVPESDRHRGHRLGDHQFADFADNRLAVRRCTPPPSRRARGTAITSDRIGSSGPGRRTRCRRRCRRREGPASRSLLTCS